MERGEPNGLFYVFLNPSAVVEFNVWLTPFLTDDIYGVTLELGDIDATDPPTFETDEWNSGFIIDIFCLFSSASIIFSRS